MPILRPVHRISRIALLLTAPTILILSLMRSPPPGPAIAHSDKILHLLAYAALGFFTYLAIGKGGVMTLVLSVGLCSLYGGAIEVLQAYFYRTPELGDWIADFLGALSGSFLAAAVRRYLISHRESSPARDETSGSQTE